MSWRIPYIIQAVIALALGMSCVLVLPTSPRWLILNGRRDKANEAANKLSIPRAEAEKDILNEASTQVESSPLSGFTTIFKRQYRARTVLAFFILGMVQLSGIDGVLYVKSPWNIGR